MHNVVGKKKVVIFKSNSNKYLREITRCHKDSV